MMLRQIGVPNGHDLRTLIHAFKTFLGLRNGFDGRNPKALCAGSIQRDADALPAVFDANDVPGKYAAKAQRLFARVDLKKTIVGIRSKKINHGLNADGDGLVAGVFKRYSFCRAGIPFPCGKRREA